MIFNISFVSFFLFLTFLFISFVSFFCFFCHVFVRFFCSFNCSVCLFFFSHFKLVLFVFISVFYSFYLSCLPFICLHLFTSFSLFPPFDVCLPFLSVVCLPIRSVLFLICFDFLYLYLIFTFSLAFLRLPAKSHQRKSGCVYLFITTEKLLGICLFVLLLPNAYSACTAHTPISESIYVFLFLEPVTCNSKNFICANGECISSRFRCDGDFDCTDNSDEVSRATFVNHTINTHG